MRYKGANQVESSSKLTIDTLISKIEQEMDILLTEKETVTATALQAR